MSKLVRACAVVVVVATSLAGGIAAAQIQSGSTRKAVPPSVALGVPVANAKTNANANANASQRSSFSATAASGGSLNFASGQPALRYLPDDLPTAKDPVRREAVKDGAKEASVSTRGAAAPAGTGEFAPAPGVLRANMPPVTFADAQRVLKARVLPAYVNQGVTAAPKTSKTSATVSTSASTSTLASAMKISGDANALGPASIAELARSLRHHPDLIYQYVRNTIEYYPVFGSQKGALGAVLDNQATAHDQATLMVELLRASGVEANGLNQYTAAGGAAMGYDANGNLTSDGTWSYGYDLDNRLKTANKTGTAASLAYDAEGRLRQTVIGASTTNLLYDATDLIAEYDAAGSTIQRRYVHGPATDEPIVWYEGSGTTAKNWFYADHLGSIVATANATGASTGIYSYGPYGEPNTTTGPRFRYTGQQLIGELGLYYYKARVYSPGLGRFLKTDPIGYKDDVNLYAYVGSNPANRTDPSGLIAREAVALAAGLGSAISSGWSASVAAFQNESLADIALKSVEGLNPTVGAAVGAGVKFLGAAKGAEDAFAHGMKYADRVRARGVQDPVSHNFPYSFDDAILATQPIPKNNGYTVFQLNGNMNGKDGVFEIGVTKDRVIDHRFFRPTK